MKKRLLAIFAILALLVACAAFSVSAESSGDTVQPNAAPAAYNGTDTCPHCGKTPGTDFEWVELTNSSYTIVPTTDVHYIVSAGKTLELNDNMTFNTASNVETVLFVQGNIQLSSGKTLRLSFLSRFGKTFYQYQLDSKLGQVCIYLLEYPNMRLNEIAYILGFCDEFHMSKVFKKKYGVSPNLYRKDRRIASDDI